ncbi:IclR family transcriptional regulator [Anaeroselena agilis]|uniref:IclR family transcriptional regulator n=1 Tax=Anaeroselena agilis TaxID=3063788 RepID=A0ABU3P2V3_9FIRM|nr:IclR family transcriptional regulator [Selenomonadales bacterium 4137-cl]
MIQSVNRAIKILDFVSTNHMARLVDISRGLGLNKSTVHGIVATLEEMGCLRQDQSTGRYELGLKLFELGQSVMANMDIRAVAMPYLLELSRKYEETVHLAVLSGDEVIYIDKVDSPRSIRIFSMIGGRNPAYCTGVGKILLAGLTDEKLSRVLEGIRFRAITPNTITDANSFVEHIRNIRRDGYATDNGEIEEGLSCFAAPIRNHLGSVTAAISLSGPTQRLINDNSAKLIEDVVDCAQTVSIQLGFAPALAGDNSFFLK